MMAPRRTWSRNQKIALIAPIVAALIGAIALLLADSGDKGVDITCSNKSTCAGRDNR
ncbi:hypothetical protein TUE45_pSRTUE45b_0101 (plasmid) [Streptomyces reticuli]|nr:hypothetical protein TUE45_pSRTUE45b_0101 [Streptomyces reticuli]